MVTRARGSPAMQRRLAKENPPLKVALPKYQKQPHAKELAGRRHSICQLDMSGKSGAHFHYSEIVWTPSIAATVHATQEIQFFSLFIRSSPRYLKN
ncbi:hypothetical protein [Bradyrhizobium elkanii]|jgi:hypothetical protein|uniref:hypothetical protein n=1 Tax=Bradyrhizobium elkanii TaxID=29448 RepID=UPI001671A9A0|nr:hypothetical protein [Bradyrhizobium elkanii]